jgi:hypothetical protein
VATKYFTSKPLRRGKTYYKAGAEIVSGFTSWWRYWSYLRYDVVTKVDSPTAPTNLVATPESLALSIAFTLPPEAVDSIDYKIGAGSWTARTPASTASPIVITGLTATSTTIYLRAVNRAGVGVQAQVTATPLA